MAGANHTVDARLYGRSLRMPAEHPLPAILRTFPQYNRPLALAVNVIASSLPDRSIPLAVIDVGANIGETAAVIDQLTPGVSYLCIEADQDIARICKFNHRDNPRVQTEQCFIGEHEGSFVHLEDDGRANPSTKLADQSSSHADSNHGRLVRLDTVASPFAEAHGGLDLIKVDTEGYDFSVLRSGASLLNRYHPSLYFEWYPDLLSGIEEHVWDGFDYLERLGYHYFVFFTSQGDYHGYLPKPDHFILRSLARATTNNKNLPYFDVFASTNEAVCKELVERSTAPMNSA